MIRLPSLHAGGGRGASGNLPQPMPRVSIVHRQIGENYAVLPASDG